MTQKKSPQKVKLDELICQEVDKRVLAAIEQMTFDDDQPSFFRILARNSKNMVIELRLVLTKKRLFAIIGIIATAVGIILKNSGTIGPIVIQMPK